MYEYKDEYSCHWRKRISGNELVRLLKQKGYENVTVLSRNLPPTLLPGVRYEQGDISRPGTLEKGFLGKKSWSTVRGSFRFGKRSSETSEINGHGAQNVLWMSEKLQPYSDYCMSVLQQLLDFLKRIFTKKLNLTGKMEKEASLFVLETFSKCTYSYESATDQYCVSFSHHWSGDPENTGKILKYVQRKKFLLLPEKIPLLTFVTLRKRLFVFFSPHAKRRFYSCRAHTFICRNNAHRKAFLQQENTIIHLPQIQRTLVRALGTFENIWEHLSLLKLFFEFCERKHLGKKYESLVFSTVFSARLFS